MQAIHIDSLVQKAEAGFSGINLDYQDVPGSQTEAFSDFVNRSADALHEKGLKLLVTLGTPTLVGNSWDSGGQDWIALGETADAVYVQLPSDPTEFDDEDSTVQL